MKPYIYCNTTAKGVQTFYVNVDGESHILFSQAFRHGVKNYFAKPVSIDRALDFSSARGDGAILRTMEKLPSYIRYVEREYDIEVLRKTRRKNEDYRKRNTRPSFTI